MAWNTVGGTESVTYVGLLPSAISNPQPGQVLQFDGANWTNADGFVPTITSPTLGQILMYDGTHWVNSSIIDGGTF